MRRRVLNKRLKRSIAAGDGWAEAWAFDRLSNVMKQRRAEAGAFVGPQQRGAF